ncbi:MAG: HAD family phosphatase [Actinomycetota bacterium]|nr:HAD family phosphatase [Actinomycetota bacterium]
MKIDGHEIKMVIFDMDGLIFDTERLAARTWKEAGKKFSYDIDYDVFKKTIGLNMLESGRVYRKYYGKEFPYEEIRNEKTKLAEGHMLSKGIPLKDSVHELLGYLKSKGLKIALATLTRRSRTEMLLGLSGTKKYFDLITCGDEIKYGKPDPEIFLSSAVRMNLKPDNCMVLEDSEYGIIAASKAGMLPVMIPDLVKPGKEVNAMIFKKFNSLKEVKSYLELNFNR